MRMTSKKQLQAERTDAHAMQREKEKEKEKERRRLRDRQRRQNMSQEQRDKHLARRRRNYQLRRLRAQNAKSLGEANSTNNNLTDLKMINHLSTSFDELPTRSETQEGEAQKLRKTPRRLRVSDIRHLARRLHSDGEQENARVLTNCVATKRLRVTHVKRLARAVKLTMN